MLRYCSDDLIHTVHDSLTVSILVVTELSSHSYVCLLPAVVNYSFREYFCCWVLQ